ncbi:DUF4254 domain-containing protein [bacterium]|nr:DUF4254 domain-containing protein [bacterium]
MAETLGSLVDKLAICDLKIWHCHEKLFSEEASESSAPQQRELATKSLSLQTQRERLIDEINQWVATAVSQPQATVLADPKNKLYGRFRRP